MRPEHSAQFGQFYAASYKHLCKAMEEMTNDPRAAAFPRDVMLTAIATACISTCALALTPSDISMKDVKYLGGLLQAEVKKKRQRAADKGLIQRPS